MHDASSGRAANTDAGSSSRTCAQPQALPSDASEEATAAFVEQWLDWFGQGGRTADLVGVPQADLDAVYSQAMSLYEHARYDEAGMLFSFLSLHDHIEPRYLWGMAGCAQVTGRPMDAIQSYALLAGMDMTDPAPVFRIAECMVELQMYAQADETCKVILELTENNGYDALREKTHCLRNALPTGAAS